MINLIIRISIIIAMCFVMLPFLFILSVFGSKKVWTKTTDLFHQLITNDHNPLNNN